MESLYFIYVLIRMEKWKYLWHTYLISCSESPTVAAFLSHGYYVGAHSLNLGILNYIPKFGKYRFTLIFPKSSHTINFCLLF